MVEIAGIRAGGIPRTRFAGPLSLILRFAAGRRA
jgi:hypothetical protein